MQAPIIFVDPENIYLATSRLFLLEGSLIIFFYKCTSQQNIASIKYVNLIPDFRKIR